MFAATWRAARLMPQRMLLEVGDVVSRCRSRVAGMRWGGAALAGSWGPLIPRDGSDSEVG